METEMQLKQLRRLAQELEQCAGKLSSNSRRLDGLCGSRSGQPLEKKLRGQSSFIKKQASLCKDMAAVLDRIVYLYEKAEETIIQSAETDTRRYEEVLRTVSLKETAHIPVRLEGTDAGPGIR